MARRRRNRSIGLALGAVGVATALAIVLATSGGGPAVAAASELLKQAPAAERAAGCERVQQTPNYANAPGTDPSIDYQHIGASPRFPRAPALSTYPTTPPASGPQEGSTLPAGVYDSAPSVYTGMHSLEHGGVIVWYAPGTTSKELDRLKAFYDRPTSAASVGQDRVIVAPYDFPDQGSAGQLPRGVQMALVAWHRLQLCTEVSLAAAFDFTSQYASPPYGGRTWKGVAREPGASM